MTEAEIAWAAGLFEGEGSIQILGSSVRLYVSMYDRDVVHRLREVMGCGGVCVRTSPAWTRPMYTWHLNKRSDVEEALKLFLPWFGSRRSEKATAALELIATFYRTCSCGTEFLAGRNDRVYCSNACALRAKRARDAARAA